MTVPDARRLLRAGYEMWSASPIWTMTQVKGSAERVAGAVRPGLQWISDGHLRRHEVLIRGDEAYVRGTMYLLGVAGWGTDPDRIDDVVGDRWVQLPARAWLRERDHSALGWFGKGFGNSEYSYYAEHLDTSVSGDSRDVRLKVNHGVLRVRQTADGAVRFIDCIPPRGISLVWAFEDTPLLLPDPEQDGRMTQAELRLALGKKPRKQSTARRPRRATVHVTAPDEPDGRWCIHSDDLAQALGVEAGYEAENLALQAVAQRRPDILPDIEGDSYDTVVCVYVPDEQTANAVAELLRAIVSDG